MPLQVHLRHLVGGRARSFMGKLPDERIMTVEFPERPGALRAFLLKTSPRWNISLFHYRKSGRRATCCIQSIAWPGLLERVKLHTTRFASTIKVSTDHVLKSYRISECVNIHYVFGRAVH